MGSSSIIASGMSPRRTALPFLPFPRAGRRRRHTSFPFPWTVVLVCLVVWGSGCAARRPSRPSPPAPLPSAQELLAPLAARQKAITSLRGLASVSYRDTHNRGSATQAIALATPDRFRLELFSLFGVAAVQTCDGQRLAAYFPRDQVLYRGAASPMNIARFTQVMLSAREVIRLLSGFPPFPIETDRTELRVRREPNGAYWIDFPRADGSSTLLWFDPDTHDLSGWAVRDQTGVLSSQGTLADYRQVQDIFFPFALTLSDGQGAQYLALTYKEVSVSADLQASLFRLGGLAGVQEIDMDAYLPHSP